MKIGWLLAIGAVVLAAKKFSPSPAAPPSHGVITVSPYAPNFDTKWFPLLHAPAFDPEQGYASVEHAFSDNAPASINTTGERYSQRLVAADPTLSVDQQLISASLGGSYPRTVAGIYVSDPNQLSRLQAAAYDRVYHSGEFVHDYGV